MPTFPFIEKTQLKQIVSLNILNINLQLKQKCQAFKGTIVNGA